MRINNVVTTGVNASGGPSTAPLNAAVCSVADESHSAIIIATNSTAVGNGWSVGDDVSQYFSRLVSDDGSGNPCIWQSGANLTGAWILLLLTRE